MFRILLKNYEIELKFNWFFVCLVTLTMELNITFNYDFNWLVRILKLMIGHTVWTSVNVRDFSQAHRGHFVNI